MLSKVYSAAIVGLDAQIVEVEVDTSFGLKYFGIVGLPDKAVEESKERVGSAIENSGFQSPHRQPVRVLVSLAPADLKKEGSIYDLPIAIGYLLSAQKIRFDSTDKIFLGELALDGRLRSIRGVVSFAALCQEKNFSEIILPEENAPEAALISSQVKENTKKIKVIGVKNLREVIDYLERRKDIKPYEVFPENFLKSVQYPIDLGYIKGQESSKRALEIVAAGAHHLLMVGSPGAGKTLLVKAIPSIMPPMTLEECLEVTKIYSIAGLLPKDKPLINFRPFRSPHHTCSEVALIGGGNPPRPGEITLSHRGVLFLDEFPEFHRDVLESLRQPIEENKITVLRAKNAITFPAEFTLVAASNPCPCGNYRDPEKECKCTNSQIRMYQRKLSGPLMDRIDLFINVPQLKYEKLVAPDEEDYSAKIREKVKKAREIQKERFGQDKTNSAMDILQIKKYCQLDGKSQALLRQYVDSGKLSPRGYHRVLKVARTIADLEQSENILFDHLAEALMYRVREI